MGSVRRWAGKRRGERTGDPEHGREGGTTGRLVTVSSALALLTAVVTAVERARSGRA